MAISKTTVLIPVSSATTLATLRTTLLSALTSTASHAASDDPDLPALPESADDIALWRLEAPEKDAEGNESEKWVRLRDEKSGADKWGVSEAEELGVSFRGGDGTFPLPTVIRPVDEEEVEQ
ncbi:uncharacterized protein JCM10292_002307 [Rhodotorula paludigena]|uniref:uncharacterized protein n=1 Tax=Rhodotorula paludigena TaxID=86838 RepID=UPI003180B8CD